MKKLAGYMKEGAFEDGSADPFDDMLRQGHEPGNNRTGRSKPGSPEATQRIKVPKK